MLGYVADLIFYHVPDKHNITGLNWRLMLGSAGFPALIVMAQGSYATFDPLPRDLKVDSVQYSFFPNLLDG